MKLAGALDIPLFADDLGLRSIARQAGVNSFSSVALLFMLTREGVIDGDTRDRALLDLIARGYVFVPPSPSLLSMALRDGQRLGQEAVRKAFGLLASPALSLDSAGELVGDLLKDAATARVQVEGIYPLTGRCLRAMATRWPRHRCARTVLSTVAQTLALLPGALEDVERACTEFR